MITQLTHANEDVAEQFNLLKYRITSLLNGQSAPPIVITFTSYQEGEGVSSVVENLALAFAADQRYRVLLVDFNHHNPLLSELSSAASRTGNGAAAAEPGAEAGEIKDLAPSGLFRANDQLDVMRPACDRNHRPRPDAVGELWGFLRKSPQQYDFVLVDGPALFRNSLATLLTVKSDYVVLVVKSHEVRRQVLQTTVNQLERMGVKLLGVIMNQRQHPIPEFIYKRI